MSCPRCGTLASTGLDYDNYPYYDRPDQQIIREFIGPNESEMFYKVCKGMPSWHAFAGFLGPIYYIYRRCWNGLIKSGIGTALLFGLLWLFLWPWLTPTTMPVLALTTLILVHGIMFYPCYKSKYRRVYNKFRNTPEVVVACGGTKLEYVVITVTSLVAGILASMWLG